MKKIAERYLSTVIVAPEYLGDRPSRNLNLLFPDFADKLKKAFKEFVRKYPNEIPYVVEGLRPKSVAAQNAAAGTGIKDSMHCYGIAADLAFLVNGKHTYNGNYPELRKCLLAQGLVLIGTNDIGHVQYIPVKDQNTFRVTITSAVKEFQKKHGLKVDGIPGTKQTIPKAKEVLTPDVSYVCFKDVKKGHII